ncbi:MAG: TRAP transporter substrate-binding protein [Proteobacteria bacterium]|nr:TRAP transporter substrate-binding protein [Pseudomonadota bacterium]
MRTLSKALVVAAVLSLATATGLSAQTVFRLGTSVTPKHPNGVMAETFKQEVEKNTGGKLTIQIFPGAALGGELELANQVKTGQLDLLSGAVPPMATLSSAMQLSELPFFYPTYDVARKVLDGKAGQMALKTLEAQNVKGLVFGEIGFRGVLNSVRPINSIDDVKGLKIRVVENRLYVDTWRALGANAVPMAWPEVYMGLQQRTIDGVDTNYAGFIDAKQYEVTKYLTLTNHSYTANVLMMNLAKFNALSDDLKNVFMAAAKAGAAASRTAAKTIDDNAVDIMTRHGIQVTRPDAEPFRKALKPVHDAYAKRIGEEIVNQALATMGAQ